MSVLNLQGWGSQELFDMLHHLVYFGIEILQEQVPFRWLTFPSGHLS